MSEADGLVDYAGARGSPVYADLVRFAGTRLNELDVASLSEDEKMAMWLNLYRPHSFNINIFEFFIFCVKYYVICFG